MHNLKLVLKSLDSSANWDWTGLYTCFACLSFGTECNYCVPVSASYANGLLADVLQTPCMHALCHLARKQW